MLRIKFEAESLQTSSYFSGNDLPIFLMNLFA